MEDIYCFCFFKKCLLRNCHINFVLKFFFEKCLSSQPWRLKWILFHSNYFLFRQKSIIVKNQFCRGWLQFRGSFLRLFVGRVFDERIIDGVIGGVGAGHSRTFERGQNFDVGLLLDVVVGVFHQPVVEFDNLRIWKIFYIKFARLTSKKLCTMIQL